MRRSGNDWLNDFSHIYLEPGVEEYFLGRKILENFPASVRISIPDYKIIFNRSNQHFQTQKRSMKLILALKKPPYLYPLSETVQGGGFRNRYYVTPIMNCLFNCDYCYLQGMYPTANILVFVNNEDLFRATEIALGNRSEKEDPVYISLSYNTDLLAFENLVPICRSWIEFTRKVEDLVIEIRTKSAFFHVLEEEEPLDRVVLAWTLSPAEVIRKYEHGTPPLEKRIRAVQRAIRRGWKVRLCIDPILGIPNWDGIYASFLEDVFSRLPVKGIRDVTLGVFRMNPTYYKRIMKQHPRADLFYDQIEITEGSVTYTPQLKERINKSILKQLSSCLPDHIPLLWI